MTHKRLSNMITKKIDFSMIANLYLAFILVASNNIIERSKTIMTIDNGFRLLTRNRANIVINRAMPAKQVSKI